MALAEQSIELLEAVKIEHQRREATSSMRAASHPSSFNPSSWPGDRAVRATGAD